MCEHVGLSRAQAYRELQVLVASPLPIFIEKHNGTAFYRIESLSVPSTKELLALSMARTVLATLEGGEIVEQLDRLLGKKIMSPLAAEAEAVVHDPEHVRILERAIFDRRKVKLEYPRDGDMRPRTVEPVELRHAQKAWYFTAWDTAAGRWKTFKLARIHNIELLAEQQAHPPFDATSTYGHSVSIWSGETFDVVIEISAAEARFAREHPLHPTQTVAPLADGGVRVEATVAGLDEVTRWILRFGKEARATNPPALVDRVATQIRGAARLYATEPSPHA